jgi:hypothetical protein
MALRGPTVSLLAVLAAAVPGAARAQSTLRAGAEFRVNEQTAGAQRRPAAAMWADGSFVVVWQSEMQDGNLFGIFGRRFDPTGAPLGPEFQVNQATLGEQTQAAVALDAQGRFTVVWRGEDGSQGGIFARQYSAAGAPTGAEVRVNVHTLAEQALPRVSAGPNGLVVVWQSDAQDGSGAGVYGRILTPNAVPVGVEIPLSVTTAGNQTAPAVAALPNGRFAVAWLGSSGSFPAVISRLFDGAGAPLNGEQVVASNYRVDHVSIAAAPYDTFTVGWWSASIFAGKIGYLTTDWGVSLREHSAAGVPGAITQTGGAGTGTTAFWEGSFATTFTGRSLVANTSAPDVLTCFEVPPPDGYCSYQAPEDGSGSSIFARAVGSPTAPPRARVNSYTASNQSRPAVAAELRGNAVIAWQSDGQDGSGMGIYAQRYGGFFPTSFAVDPGGNGVLDPGLAEEVRTSWHNRNGAAQAFGGWAWGLAGPAGATYSIPDAFASFGTVANGAVGSCAGDCYRVTATPAPSRPAVHWDAHLGESLLPEAVGVHAAWTLHVGGSFADVSSASPFYRFIETLLHNGVNNGCGGNAYCPLAAFTRDEMARSLLLARHGAGYAPPACGAPVFADVPSTSPFCPWIEELARRGVVGGCGGGNYCPTAAVSREQLPVFVLRTLDPAFTPPACGAPRFADVPASSPFCRWIEELARRGVVGGCAAGIYCPTALVSREQMAVFLTQSFGLRLY